MASPLIVDRVEPGRRGHCRLLAAMAAGKPYRITQTPSVASSLPDRTAFTNCW
jgi:hypothetical protein